MIFHFTLVTGGLYFYRKLFHIPQDVTEIWKVVAQVLLKYCLWTQLQDFHVKMDSVALQCARVTHMYTSESWNETMDTQLLL